METLLSLLQPALVVILVVLVIALILWVLIIRWLWKKVKQVAKKVYNFDYTSYSARKAAKSAAAVKEYEVERVILETEKVHKLSHSIDDLVYGFYGKKQQKLARKVLMNETLAQIKSLRLKSRKQE